MCSIILPTLVTILAFVVVKKINAWWIKTSNRLPFPPGPKPKPIVANMFDFPTSDHAMHYHSWGKKYNSNILHASTLGNHVIVLNSLEDAEELLERRASNYSDRMDLPMLKLLGYDTNMAFMRHGTVWRNHRRIAQQNFRLDSISSHQPIQRRRIHLMLKGLLEDPDSAFTQHKMLSLSIPLEFMYGYDVTSLDDPFITQASKAIELASNYFNPASTLINFFPVLGNIPSWIPGATTQKVAATVKNIVHRLETEPMKLVKRDLAEGVANRSVFSDFLEAKHGTSGFEEEAQIVSQLALTIYSGASDTIVCALGSLFYLLATRPDIQKKGQEEIDRVIGTDRLPDFSDRSTLPYTDALYHELLRFWPPTPMAIPHCAREDDTYKGYFIPKGTTVFANVWAMTRDESLYPEPYDFKPERFINEKGDLITDTRVLTYGFGRRICVGKYSASSTLWLTIASLLTCFTISKSKDTYGNEVKIPDEFIYDSIMSHKTPFRCSITPRSPVIQDLVNEVVAAEKLPKE